MRLGWLLCASLLLNSCASCYARLGSFEVVQIRFTHQRANYDKIQPSLSGYVDINREKGSSLYYAYYEALAPTTPMQDVPILLWLQGGPGCASTFGGFYGIGPHFVVSDTEVEDAKGPWNQHFGLLLIDQPIGSGFSRAGNDTIPPDQPAMAEHLYAGLQGFFRKHAYLQPRPFFITGESYGGKYIPAIATRILNATKAAHDAITRRPVHEALQDSDAPVFKLMGVAIGNGLTDPSSQALSIADAAYYMGLASNSGRSLIKAAAEKVVALAEKEDWEAATAARGVLLELVQNVTGTPTLLDVRRSDSYDADKLVDKFLDQVEVKKVMRADPEIEYRSCSHTVEVAMAADIMKSIKHLLPGVLEGLHVLLYQGAFDIQDGPASNDAWSSTIEWPGAEVFNALNTTLWYNEAKLAGWFRTHQHLTQVVIRNAGHMVPHDQPVAAQDMIEAWVCSSLVAEGHPYALSQACSRVADVLPGHQPVIDGGMQSRDL